MHPKLLEIQLTPSCNMNCIYCGNDPELKTCEDLSVEDALKAIDALKPETVLFTGGEVYHAWETLLGILEACRGKGLKYILSSNLSLIHADELDLLIDTYGFRTFHSSFNDLTEEMSEAVRNAGRKARQRLIDNLRHLTGRGMEVRVETMLISPNTEHLLEINHFLAGLGVRTHKLEYLIPTGYADDSLLLSPEYIVQKVLDLYYRKTNSTVLELTCFCLTPCMPGMEELYAIQAPDLVFSKCIDGRESCYLLSNGTLVPCFLFPESASEVNVRTSDLLHEWNHNPIFQGYRTLPDACTQCDRCHYTALPGHKSCSNGCATYHHLKGR